MQMTDAQVMTLALSIAVPLSLLIYSNSRITDTRDRVIAEIGKIAAELNAKIDKVALELNSKVDKVALELNSKLDALTIKVDAIKSDVNQTVKIHELEYHK